MIKIDPIIAVEDVNASKSCKLQPVSRMTIFPAQYSTLCAKALGEELSKRYGLANCSCRLLIRNVSDTYLLEAPGRQYIFKLYRDGHRKLEEIRGEAALLTHLAQNGANVSYPLYDRDGEQLQGFQAAEGQRWGLLFTYAPGTPESKPSTDQLRTLGKEMAKVHQITSRLELPFKRTPYTLETTITRPLKILRQAFTQLPEEYRDLDRMAEHISGKIQELDLAAFPYGYCHFDFMPKNFHFDRQGQITFFDFDFAGPGHFIYDITSFYVHYFLEVCYGRTSPDEARRSMDLFISAYSASRTISSEEIAAIRYFGFTWWLFYLGFQQENYDDWSSIFFNERFIKARVELMKRWLEEPLYIS